jgi:hypothetical protein
LNYFDVSPVSYIYPRHSQRRRAGGGAHRHRAGHRDIQTLTSSPVFTFHSVVRLLRDCDTPLSGFAVHRWWPVAVRADLYVENSCCYVCRVSCARGLDTHSCDAPPHSPQAQATTHCPTGRGLRSPAPDGWVAGFCVAGFSIRQQKTRIIKPEIASGARRAGGMDRASRDAPPPLFIWCAYRCRRAREPPSRNPATHPSGGSPVGRLVARPRAETTRVDGASHLFTERTGLADPAPARPRPGVSPLRTRRCSASHLNGAHSTVKADLMHKYMSMSCPCLLGFLPLVSNPR